MTQPDEDGGGGTATANPDLDDFIGAQTGTGPAINQGGGPGTGTDDSTPVLLLPPNSGLNPNIPVTIPPPVPINPASAGASAATGNVAGVQSRSLVLQSTNRFDKVLLRGGPITASIDAEVIDMTVSMSTSMVTQLSVTLEDNGFARMATGIFAGKPTMTYDGLALTLTSIRTRNNNGIPQIQIEARSSVIEKLKQLRGGTSAKPTFVMRARPGLKVTASTYVQAECRNAGGVPCVVDVAPEVAFISRDVSPFLQPTVLDAPDEIPSAWTTIKRYAEEYGFMAFESGNILYFCKPSFLFERARVVRAHFGSIKAPSKPSLTNPRAVVVDPLTGKQSVRPITAHGPVAPTIMEILDPPTCDWSSDSRETTITFDVESGHERDLLPGYVVELSGVPYFNGAYLINQVDYSLASDRITVTAGTPIDAPPSNPGGLMIGFGAGGDTGASSLGDATDTSSDKVGLPACGIKDVNQFMKGIRLHESSGNYTARSTASSASGAYQIIDKRWRELAGDTIANQYARAYLAPPEVQDQVARNYFSQMYNALGDWGAVAVSWIYTNPDVYNSPSRWKTYKYPANSKNPTAYNYALSVLRKAGGISCGQFAQPQYRPTKQVQDFVSHAVQQSGKPYVYGASASIQDVSPAAFDCSELVQWAAGRVGVSVPRTSEQQYEACKKAGLLIPVGQALKTQGALLFKGNPGSVHHVAISMGDGRTDMAAHTANTDLAHQISVAETTAGYWDSAGLIPGMDYSTASVGSTKDPHGSHDPGA